MSSAATESSGLTSLDAAVIDPQLLELDAFDDDCCQTPTQPRSLAQPVDTAMNNFSELSPILLGDLHQDYERASQASTPHRSAVVLDAPRGFGHFHDMDFSSLDFSVFTNQSASITQKASTHAHPYFPRTPTKSQVIPHARSAPAAYEFCQPIIPYDDHQHGAPISPCVRHSLSAAKSARLEADLLTSRGDIDAAASAFSNAMHWEKKARRRQQKDDSQKRIRAQKRAKTSARTSARWV